MAWITEVQANEFLNPNPEWDEFTNKGELLKLASNRLEQLTFRDEDIDRVGARYIDGNSVSKVAGTAEFLLKAVNGNFAYHAEKGWTRDHDNMDLLIYPPITDIENTAVAFDFPDLTTAAYNYEQILTFKQIQSLHSFGGTFGGVIALDIDRGAQGNFTTIQCKQATSIVGKDGEPVFPDSPIRRINASFLHNGITVELRGYEGTDGVNLNGIDEVEVINEQGETVVNIVPEVLVGEYFDYSFKVENGLDQTLFLYIKGILVGNPRFAAGGQSFNRLLYGIFSGSSINGRSYIKEFGSVINTENPITIPIRLVGACALLAFEYGKFPPNYVGDKEYLDNETDYNTAQDLPINVQAAVEPFLGEYIVPVILDDRGEVPEKQPTASPLGYVGEE